MYRFGYNIGPIIFKKRRKKSTDFCTDHVPLRYIILRNSIVLCATRLRLLCRFKTVFHNKAAPVETGNLTCPITRTLCHLDFHEGISSGCKLGFIQYPDKNNNFPFSPHQSNAIPTLPSASKDWQTLIKMPNAGENKIE